MDPIRVGLVADPASPTRAARRMTDIAPLDGEGRYAWDIQLVSEPFTVGLEDVGTALARLRTHSAKQQWDLVIGLTELPLRENNGRYVVASIDAGRQSAVLSLPALGGFRVRSRARDAVLGLVSGMAEAPSSTDRRSPLPGRTSRARLLLGMVLANRPWALAAGLKSALVAALATGAVATIEPTVWQLAASLSGWRLAVATVASIVIVVSWIIIDGQLWDRPEDGSEQARERSRLYNASTLLTLTIGVIMCYAVLYVVNLAWATFVLAPDVLGSTLGEQAGPGDFFVLSWFVASVATLGGALGTGLESDEAIRAAAYSKREEDRRARLAAEQT